MNDPYYTVKDLIHKFKQLPQDAIIVTSKKDTFGTVNHIEVFRASDKMTFLLKEICEEEVIKENKNFVYIDNIYNITD